MKTLPLEFFFSKLDHSFFFAAKTFDFFVPMTWSRLERAGSERHSGLFGDVFDRFAKQPLFSETPTQLSVPSRSFSTVLPDPPKRPAIVEMLMGSQPSLASRSSNRATVRPVEGTAYQPVERIATHHSPYASRPDERRGRTSASRSRSGGGRSRHRVRADNWMPMSLLESTAALFDQLERRESAAAMLRVPEWAVAVAPPSTDPPTSVRPQASPRPVSAAVENPSTFQNLGGASVPLASEEVGGGGVAPTVRSRGQMLFTDDLYAYVKSMHHEVRDKPRQAEDKQQNVERVTEAVDLDELNRLLDERTPSEGSYAVPFRIGTNVSAQEKKELMRGFSAFCNNKKKMPSRRF